MKNSDTTHGVDMHAPKSQSPAFRWAMRIMLTVCGLMMVAILLSRPQAEPYVKAGLAQVDEVLASFNLGSDASQEVVELTAPIAVTTVSPDATADEPPQDLTEVAAEKPAVRAMPTNRVPVRRMSQTREN